MTKKFAMLAVAALAVVISPMLSAVRADSGGWESIQATDAWTYDGYKVERLSFDDDAVGPISMGDQVIVAEPVASCDPTGCDRYDISVLENGMKMFIGNVPAEALDEEKFFNNGAFIYMDAEDMDEERWNVVEVNLEDGSETLELDGMFIDGVDTIDVIEEDGVYYLNPFFNWNNRNGYLNSTILSYDPETDIDRIVSDHWQMNQEQLQDAKDGKVLSIMAFPGGETQLWVYDTTTDPYTLSAVPETWTPSTEKIVGAHFRDDGSVEYFRMYQRYVFDGEETIAQGDYLSWYRSEEDALQVVGGRMAWLDASDVLRVSDEDGVTNLGTIGYPSEFRLTPDELFYASGNGGKMLDFATGLTTSYDFAVTDTLSDIVVGVDGSDNIWFEDTSTGQSMKIGTGSDPVISDDMHVYWSGTDGVYEATITVGALDESSAVAVKVSGDSTVYVVVNDVAYAIPNESVYFSWFESWTDVTVVSSATLDGYEDGGDATYAPGTRLKLGGDPKVYMVGEDGKLHWITTQTIAYTIYGSTWNQGIIEISQMDLTGLSFGTSILTEGDIQSI